MSVPLYSLSALLLGCLFSHDNYGCEALENDQVPVAHLGRTRLFGARRYRTVYECIRHTRGAHAHGRQPSFLCPLQPCHRLCYLSFESLDDCERVGSSHLGIEIQITACSPDICRKHSTFAKSIKVLWGCTRSCSDESYLGPLKVWGKAGCRPRCLGYDEGARSYFFKCDGKTLIVTSLALF